MTFITPLLLAGTVLVALPIVLHLVMRRKPQRVMFPALRFVESRRSANQTRLQLRHWLLLALRCALIALLALALSRPTLRGSGRLGGANAPVAAALVFDNSLRMNYQSQNRSRLDDAKEMASWLLKQLPIDTPTTVVARGDRHRSFAVDRGAADLKVDRLQPKGATRPLVEAVRDATQLLSEKKDEYRGEIYVFTDFAQASWSEEDLASMAEELDNLPGASLYIIDVGAEKTRNLGLGPLKLNSQVLTLGSILEVETSVLVTGPVQSSKPETVELLLADSEDGSLVKRGEKTVMLADDSSVQFLLAGLTEGTHQGVVRVISDDPLREDNSRFFTVEVRPAWKVLIVANQRRDALFLQEAIAPSDIAGGVVASYECEIIEQHELREAALANYDAICLLDPGSLPTAAWDELYEFARTGGGIGLFLGRQAKPSDFESSAASDLLAGTLRWQSKNETYLRPTNFSHPLLKPLSDYGEGIPWSNFPVFKYWEFDHDSIVAAGANVVARFANGSPAIVERTVEQGRALTITTSFSDSANNNPWNLLPSGPDPWPFIALSDGIASYLCGARSNRLNYQAGQTAVVQLAIEERTTNYVLRLPDRSAVRQTLPPGRGEAIVSTTAELGNYQLLAGGKRGDLNRGFSVNPPPEISDLARANFSDIQSALGKERVQIARSTDQIEVSVGLGRRGQELFPWLICFVAVVLGTEHLLANRFYRQDP